MYIIRKRVSIIKKGIVRLVIKMVSRYLLLLVIYGSIDWLLGTAGFAFRYRPFQIINIIILLAIGTKNSFEVYKYMKGTESEENIRVARIFTIAVPAIVIAMAFEWTFPLTKDLGGGMICETQPDSGVYRYYDKRYLILKQEFTWDVKHDIKILESTYNMKFFYDSTSGNKRLYIPQSDVNTRVEIEKYPTVTDWEVRTNFKDE